MLTEDFAQWQRYEAAICECSGNQIDDIFTKLVDNPHLVGVIFGRTQRVARALGLDKRRHIKDVRSKSEWVAACWTPQKLREIGVQVWQLGEYWHATSVFPDFRFGEVQVTGHTTRESAIHHLERILGRVEYDHFFTEMK